MLLGKVLNNDSLGEKTLSHFWSMGYGAISLKTVITPLTGSLTRVILVANLPQVILSFLYLTYNSLFTCMLVAKEWISLIAEITAQLKHARLFTKIDIRQAFHKLRMAAESEDLTTFISRYGAFKWNVLTFGLTGPVHTPSFPLFFPCFFDYFFGT